MVFSARLRASSPIRRRWLANGQFGGFVGSAPFKRVVGGDYVTGLLSEQQVADLERLYSTDVELVAMGVPALDVVPDALLCVPETLPEDLQPAPSQASVRDLPPRPVMRAPPRQLPSRRNG